MCACEETANLIFGILTFKDNIRSDFFFKLRKAFHLDVKLNRVTKA